MRTVREIVLLFTNASPVMGALSRWRSPGQEPGPHKWRKEASSSGPGKVPPQLATPHKAPQLMVTELRWCKMSLHMGEVCSTTSWHCHTWHLVLLTDTSAMPGYFEWNADEARKRHQVPNVQPSTIPNMISGHL